MVLSHLEFRLKNILWVIGVGFLIFQALLRWGGAESRWKTIGLRCRDYAEKNFFKFIFGICLSFFSFFLLAKYSQLTSLMLHGQDFWLFVDMLEQMKKGGFFLTHFAPQSLGLVQHGVVRPTPSWAILVPIAWGVGSTWAALIFAPLFLTAAAFLLAVLSRKNWGTSNGLLFALAFLASTQVGKILMYEVHPESAYPFFVFLWFWALGWDGSQKVRWPALVVAILGGVGIREDALIIFFPWMIWAYWKSSGRQRLAVALSAGCLVLAFWVQTHSIQSWLSETWGPHVWEGEVVVRDVGVRIFKGLHWSSPREILSIFYALIQDQGGVSAFVKGLIVFLASRPWLSLVILAPWVLVDARSWFVLLPLAGAYSLLEGPRHLWNYYSAPFLGSFWFCAITSAWKPSSQRKVVWALSMALLLGGSAEYFSPTPEAQALKIQAEALVKCIAKETQRKGIVQSHLLGLLPLEKVWTDRVPQSQEQWKSVDFALFSPGLDRYEMSADGSWGLMKELQGRKDWRRVASSCDTVLEPSTSLASGMIDGVRGGDSVVLYLRKATQGIRD